MAVVQRVKNSTRIISTLENKSVEDSFKGPGLVVLIAWSKSDEMLNESELIKKENWMQEKIQGLRIFPDSNGKMNLNLENYLKELKGVEGGVL